MKIAVVGTGYVGLVTGACFAEMGNHVTCVDRDADKVERMRNGECPIFEARLPELMRHNISEGRLFFSSSLAEVTSSCDLFFLAVGTDALPDGSVDLSQVWSVAQELGRNLEGDAIVVIKSTVPIGTSERVESVIQEELERRQKSFDVPVVSNPEFLKEGVAVDDFMRPARVIIGTDNKTARETLGELYRAFAYKRDRILFMGRREAEMSKYAANAMLATRISFINEIANLCDSLDVDVELVRRGIGSDPRIGDSFIYPGVGYGGSCFPKDIKALIHMAGECDMDPQLLRAVEARNNQQKRRLPELVQQRYGHSLVGRQFGIWGLSFKPGTDDLREAPAREVLASLIELGARVVAYDPKAMPVARKEFPAEWFTAGKLEFAEDQYAVCKNSDALVLVTEWKQFRQPDFDLIKELLVTPVIFDGRNQYEPGRMHELGFEYIAIGRRSA